MKSLIPVFLALALLVSFAPAQAPQRNQQPASVRRALEINGQSAPDAVIQVNGRAYADVLAISQLTGAAVAVRPDRIIVNLPGGNAATPPSQQQSNRLSKEFSRAAIAFLADLREWKNATETAVSIGAPQSRALDQWLAQHRSRAEESLHLASVAASTPADRIALRLLQSQFSNVQQWDAAAAQARQNFDASRAVDPNALTNDPQLTKIADCDRFLSDMLSSGTPADSPVCR